MVQFRYTTKIYMQKLKHTLVRPSLLLIRSNIVAVFLLVPAD